MRNVIKIRECVCGGCDGEAAKRRGNELARPRRAHDSPATRALDCDGDDEATATATVTTSEEETS